MPRMAGVGGESWECPVLRSGNVVGDRGSIAEIMHKGDGADYSDKGLEALLSSYIEEKKKEDAPVYERKVHVVGRRFLLPVGVREGQESRGQCFCPFPAEDASASGRAWRMCQDWISARKHWRKFTPNRDISNRQSAFTAN